MPDSRSHRGPDTRDAQAFAPEARAALARAVAEFSWLLDRGYASPSALKLVGDRWSLIERQRMAVLRSACTDGRLRSRLCRRVEPEDAEGLPIAIDGFNLLTTIEAALGGGVLLIGRDGCLRDLSGVHGSYRRVEETRPAIRRVGEFLQALDVVECLWLLDRPVSNSGRLGGILREMALDRGWSWEVELVNNPDTVLADSDALVVSADSQILDRARSWLNLARELVSAEITSAWVVDLSATGAD